MKIDPAPRDTGAAEASADSTHAGSQTLARGLRALELLSERPLTILELADGLGVHRSSAYRVLRTLEEYRFVTRDQDGRIRLGAGLAALARGVSPALHSAATPIISDLANELEMTAFVSVLEGDDVITLLTVEPSHVTATISRNPGVRHPLERGAAGHAIEASLSLSERNAFLGDRSLSPQARQTRRRGYAISRNEVIAGVTGLAVPLRVPGEPPAAIAVVHFDFPTETDEIGAKLRLAAERIISRLQ